MTNKKCIITISVPNNTTQDEIKEIRRIFNEQYMTTEYKLHILVSGDGDISTILKNIIVSKFNLL